MGRACSRCGGSRRGSQGACLDCKALDANKRYYKNHERLKTAQRDYYKTEKGLTARKRQQKQSTSQIRFKHNLVRFGLSVEDYAWLLHGQDFKCACCQDTLRMGKHTHVDHHHITDRVRGILCHYCNTSLGLLKESPGRIRALLHYLEKYND